MSTKTSIMTPFGRRAALRWGLALSVMVALVPQRAEASPVTYSGPEAEDSLSLAVLDFLADDARQELEPSLSARLAEAHVLNIFGPADQRYDAAYWQQAFNPLDAAHAAKLKDVLAATTRLKRLTLANYPISAAAMAGLGESLRGCAKLEALGLFNVVQHGQGFEHIVTHLAQMRALRSLALGGDDYPHAVWAPLARSIEQLPDLEELTLSDLGDLAFDVQGTKRIFDAIAALGQLRYLDLRGTAFGPQVADKVTHLLQRTPHLTRLNLRNLQLGDAGVRALMPALLSMPSLAWVDLGWNKLSDAGRTEIREQIGTRAGLQSAGL